MSTPSMRPEIRARRSREYEATTTAAEVAALHRSWDREDREILAIEDHRSQALDDLARRVAKLEQSLGPGGVVMQGIGGALGMIRIDIDKKIAAVADAQVTFKGVFQPGTVYDRNSLSVHKGGMWIALETTNRAPGSDPTWQLVTKAGQFEKGSMA